jgi:hypothetical protein
MTRDSIVRTRLVRGALLGLAAIGLGIAGYLMAAVPPTPDSYYPKCSLYQLTGLHCPGCGTGRAVHFLLNGELATAFRFNPFAVLALPVLVLASARMAVRWYCGRPVSSQQVMASRWIWLLLVAILLFWILRNLPMAPFTLLAPPVLPASLD